MGVVHLQASRLRPNDIPADFSIAEFYPPEKAQVLARDAYHFGTESPFTALDDDARYLVTNAFDLHIGNARCQEIPYLFTPPENIGPLAHMAVVFPDLVVGPCDVIGEGLYGAVGIAPIDAVEVAGLQKTVQLRFCNLHEHSFSFAVWGF
jgi:hypothetical protein